MKLKQPFETFRLAVPFGQPVASVSAVTISPRGLVPSGPALVPLAPVIVGSEVRLDLLAGADGERYLITVRAAATSGDLMEREAELAVVDLAWAVPDVATSYLSAQAFVERHGLDNTIRLTDTEGAGRIDAARLGGALVDASAEVDGYLAARFVTPLSAPSPMISGIVFDLALARLWIGEAPDSVRERARAATARLKDIAAGLITLPDAELLAPASTSPAPVLIGGSERPGVLTRDRLGRL